MWVVKQYFAKYQQDKTQFKASILTIEKGDIFEIIAINENTNIIYYKNNIKKIDLHNQVSKTMSFIVDSASNNDIAVYDITQDLIKTFHERIYIKTRIISNVFVYDNSSINYKAITNTLSLFLFLSISYQIYEIHDVKSEINNNFAQVQSQSKKLQDEAIFWNNIPNNAFKRVSIKKIIKKMLNNLDNIMCNTIDFSKDIENGKITCNIKIKQINTNDIMWKRHFDCENYKFDSTFINGVITCNGITI